MFDLGWQEFLMVAVVLMLVVGPKDLPRILRSFSKFMRQAKSMASEFTSSLEDVARQDEIKSMMSDVKSGNFDDMANMIGGDIKQAAQELKDASQISSQMDGVKDDLTEIASSSTSPKASPKASKKPAAKKQAKKKATSQKVAKKASKS